MAHIIISHTREDSAFAHDLRDRLTAAGMRVWMVAPPHIREDWHQDRSDALEDAFALVVIMTGAAKRSEVVTVEWARAVGAGVPVVPVLLERVALHPYLEALHPHDFSEPAIQPFDALLEDVRQIEAAHRARQDAPDTFDAFRDPDAVPALLALHEHTGEPLRTAIRDLIVSMGDRAAPLLIDLLYDSDDPLQQIIAHLLVRIGDPAIPALEQALHSDHGAVQFIAAHTLGEIGSTAAVPALLAVLDSGDIHLRRLLVHTLALLADPRAIPALITCLDDRDMQTVAAAVEALGRMEAREAVPALCHVVGRPEPTLKLAAIQVLGRLGDARAAPTLIQAFDYSELQFQLTTAEALAQLRSADAIGPLTELIDHPNATLRRTVVRALADTPHDDAIAGLHAALVDRDPQIVQTAAVALITRGAYTLFRDIYAAARRLPAPGQRAIFEHLFRRDDNLP